VPVLAQMLQSQWEARHAADELMERYEEINLLYSISEILGRTVTLEEAARTILLEVSDTVGADYGALLVFDSAAGLLRPVTTLRAPSAPEATPIPIDDPLAVSSRVQCGCIRTALRAASGAAVQRAGVLPRTRPACGRVCVRRRAGCSRSSAAGPPLP